MNKLAYFSSLALGLALAGCGTTIVDHGGSGGSGSGGGSGTGGSGDGTGVASGPTSSSSTGGGACAGFEDQKGSATVTVRFRNLTPIPIYLPSLCDGIDYSIKPAAGGPIGNYVFDASCLQTCQSLETQPPYACGACAPNSFTIASGQTLDVHWNGDGLESTSMPASCFESPSNSNSCERVVAAPAGSYVVDATAYASCEAGDGDCKCDPSGVCFGTPSGAQAYADQTTFDFPSSGVVEVTFNTCAFGCPD